jgi:hypothetical protein
MSIRRTLGLMSTLAIAGVALSVAVITFARAGV